jgi:hypothetical protein
MIPLIVHHQYRIGMLAGGFCETTTKNKPDLMPYLPRVIKMDWVGFEPMTLASRFYSLVPSAVDENTYNVLCS